jgi:hypothetical protein
MSSLVDGFFTAVSSDYAKDKKILNNKATTFKSMGLIALVASVALAILGIALCITTGGIGAIPLIGSAVFLYFGYNNLMMGKNFQTFADNPIKHISIFDTQNEARKLIGKDTFLYDWAVDCQANKIG